MLSPQLPLHASGQVVCEPQTYPEVSKVAARLRNEYCVAVRGQLRLRKDPNNKIPSGAVELLAQEVCGH